MNPQNNHPPQQVEKVLRWLCKSEVLEEILGDLEEYYAELTEKPRWQQVAFYWFQAINFLRPFALKKINTFQPINHIPMFKNYYKTSSRNLLRNPLSSFINVFGLSMAIGVCLVVYAFLKYDYSVDRFHEFKDEVYLITFSADRSGTEERYGLTPRPLGEMLQEDFTHIKKVCRVEDKNVVLKNGDKVFHESVRFSDPAFLEVFTFPLKLGVKSSLSEPNNIILSEEMATKYFGDENPLGQDIQIIFEEGRSKTFKVSGVAEPFPEAHIIDFGFLVHFDNLRTNFPSYNTQDWGGFVNATLIQVNDPSDLAPIAQGMTKYQTLHNEAQPDWKITSFEFEQLADLHLNSGDIKNDISYDASSQGRITLPIIALFMLALACFNYINIAIVSAAKRLKEIGVRKVIGANRSKVITQFLAENILVTAFAIIIGLLLAITVFLPWFIEIARRSMELSLLDGNLWIFLVALLFLTGIASGIYPAFYISRFNVVNIFKGSIQFGKKNPLTKVLLGFQLILACITITSAVVFTQNTTYLNNRSWGYNQQRTLYADVADAVGFDRLNALMIRHPDVLSTAGSTHHLGKTTTTAFVQQDNRQYEVAQLSVGADYFETMELQLTEGRIFKDRSENDKQAVVVNELLVKNMVLEQPIGQLLEIDSTKYEVIGVVKDFHEKNFYYEVQPTIFRLADQEDYRYLSMSVRPGAEQATYQALQSEWTALFPEIPFQGGYQEDVWTGFFEQVDTQERFMKTIALVAVLLAGLGLYGLITLNVSGRTKEFSIRKVLGAGLSNIAVNITRQYTILCLVALVLGLPISYVLTKASMDMMYPISVPIGYLEIALPAVILVVVLLAVVSTQVRKVSKSNLVEGLRTE
ncbi:MAG: ABC transporter permease [Bacteroidota bacterium]